MQRELTDEAEFFQKGSSKMPAGSKQNLAQNYAALMQKLGK
jgi:hypothetical protein